MGYNAWTLFKCLPNAAIQHEITFDHAMMYSEEHLDNKASFLNHYMYINYLDQMSFVMC